MKAVQYFVSGRVQGVGFRYFAMRQARSLKISGWVRNKSDGSVEIWAEGSEDSLNSFKIALSNGPQGSYVEDVRSQDSLATGQHSEFDITY